jgi:hypothetical protein
MPQAWPTPYLFARFTRIDDFAALVLGRLNSLGVFAAQRALPDISLTITLYFIHRLRSRIDYVLEI